MVCACISIYVCVRGCVGVFVVECGFYLGIGASNLLCVLFQKTSQQ